jgi:hypothetical protein
MRLTARQKNVSADERDTRLDLLRGLRLELPDLSRDVLLALVKVLPMAPKTRRELRVLFGAPRG